MGHGLFDSILGSYSFIGIDFYPQNPSKNISSEAILESEMGLGTE